MHNCPTTSRNPERKYPEIKFVALLELSKKHSSIPLLCHLKQITLRRQSTIGSSYAGIIKK